MSFPICIYYKCTIVIPSRTTAAGGKYVMDLFFFVSNTNRKNLECCLRQIRIHVQTWIKHVFGERKGTYVFLRASHLEPFFTSFGEYQSSLLMLVVYISRNALQGWPLIVVNGIINPYEWPCKRGTGVISLLTSFAKESRLEAL